MALKQLRIVRTEERDLEPVSPIGQYFNSSVLSVSVLCIFELEIPIDDSKIMSALKNEFLQINQRFSSIMVEDEHGVLHWKRVEVNLEDHIIVPLFPDGLPPETYEEYLQDYLSKIAMDPLPQNRPLWDFHMIKYPTINSPGTVIFKFHHAIGDGFSLMSALFSYVKRADDPSIPLTFPSSASCSKSKHLQGGEANNICRRLSSSLSMLWYTAGDFAFSLLKSSCNWLEDDPTPIRSSADGIEFRPITISSCIFSLDRIRQVKTKVGGTVNDVMCGVIFYGIQLYMQKAGNPSRDARATALVLLNTRSVTGYRRVEEMTKPNAECPWGNDFGFIHVPIPCYGDGETVDPLEFVSKAKQIMKRKKNSLAISLTGRMLEIMRKFRGREVVAKYIHATSRNTSMGISNMVGPIEKLTMAGHPTKSFYFLVVGVPQSLTVTLVSYMGTVRVAVGTEKGFIDSQQLMSCFDKAFTRIFEAAVGEKMTPI